MPTKRTDYRVILHYADGVTRARYPASEAEDNEVAMVELLDREVFAGHATGGHLEELIEFAGVGPGYVVSLGDEEVMK